ncbi:isonocardicin synthase-like [Haliotis asinina]|uniref:isonocardicin synthase-like n=1 Tax=Haliotis asinina TaxID=109174 RepID=UPI0035325D65
MTSEEDRYDGIYKFVQCVAARKIFLEARQTLASGNWDSSISLFGKARKLSTDYPEDVNTVDLILKEMERYQESRIPDEVSPVDTINLADVDKRPISRLDEENSTLPQGIFFLNVSEGGSVMRLVGRKFISENWIANKIPELFCSIIRAEMILGVYADMRVTEGGYTMLYRPFSSSEKLRAFKDIVLNNCADVELVFPFPLLKKDTKREFGSPPEGWSIDDAFDVMLSHGEEHIRQFTVTYLSTLKLKSPRLYDPACSTGVFLSTMKTAFPNCYTIGQDQQMADLSRQRVDEVHCGNALEPKIKSGSADVVFVRFLNSQVVRSAEAESLLLALLPTVRDGGYMMVFGHTPVLLSSSNFAILESFTLLQNIGATKDKTGIFQYYILRKD